MSEKKPKYKYIIGIDPDLHKSGYAVYDVEDKKLNECGALSMWQIFNMLESLHEHCIVEEYIVRLEYPKNTNSWHGASKGSALNVGKNQAVAIIIKEYLEAFRMNFELINPAGYSNFFKDEKFFKQQTGFSERTNQDARAAAAMCWGYK